MDYEDFEGIKKIKLTNDINIEDIYDILKKYQEITGEVKYLSHKEDLKIVVDVDGEYYIDIILDGENIVIERKLEIQNAETQKEDVKSLSLVQTDRMIEQIYDLLKEYIEKGKLTEEITKAKEVLFVKQTKRKALGGLLQMGDVFEVKNEKGEDVYEIKQNILNKSFSLYNLKTKREEAVIRYVEENVSKFIILKHPFENIVIKKDPKSEKTKFIAEFSTKKLKISGDYTDNHYLIELNEIVIGAVDSLDPMTKLEYRLEINNLEFAYIVVAFSIIADIYAEMVK